MNILLEFAGVILYHAFMIFLRPLQAVLYLLFGLWLALAYTNKLFIYAFHFLKQMPAYIWLPVRRAAGYGVKKLVRVPVHSAH